MHSFKFSSSLCSVILIILGLFASAVVFIFSVLLNHFHYSLNSFSVRFFAIHCMFLTGLFRDFITPLGLYTATRNPFRWILDSRRRRFSSLESFIIRPILESYFFYLLVRIFTTIKEIPEFPCLVGRQGCASSAKGGRWWSETSSFLRMQESLHSFVVSKRTSIFFYLS